MLNVAELTQFFPCRLCHVEYACDFKGDTLCVWFNATDPLVSKAKSAQVVALFEAENMTVRSSTLPLHRSSRAVLSHTPGIHAWSGTSKVANPCVLSIVHV